MATAPFCPLPEPAPPVGTPSKPIGFQKIPPGATTEQIITIINNNFTKLAPQIRNTIEAFLQQNLTQLITKNLNGGNWAEVRTSRIVQRIRITNPEDPEQYVDVDQINRVVMQDKETGATWIWAR